MEMYQISLICQTCGLEPEKFLVLLSPRLVFLIIVRLCNKTVKICSVRVTDDGTEHSNIRGNVTNANANKFG